MEKDNFCFTQTGSKPKIFYPKKCANYNNSYLRQNSVNGPKYLNSAKKMSKKHKVLKNGTKKRKIATLLTFSIKQHDILQRFYPTLFARWCVFSSLIRTSHFIITRYIFFLLVYSWKQPP